MTPELKKACELVFQEHKSNRRPFTWNKDAFRGRLPFGLSAMAKEVLVKKNILYFPNPEKKFITQLSPAASSAADVEEAESLLQNKVSVRLTSIPEEQPAAVLEAPEAPIHLLPEEPARTSVEKNYRLVRVTTEPLLYTNEVKWYRQPRFYQVLWPACAAIAGAAIAWALGFIYSKLFF